MNSRLLILPILFLFACVENYEFEIENTAPSLVVEGFISNQSYNASKLFPSDGRRFSIKLKETSRVANIHDKAVRNAKVSIVDNEGIITDYEELIDVPGTYTLNDDSFSAKAGIQYKLVIALSDNEIYETNWQEIPNVNVPEMGDVCFEEVEKKVYRWRIDEYVLAVEKGVNISIDLPLNTSDEPIYYRWKYDPTWVYIAPLASVAQPDYKCWATNELYLSSYALKMDEVGGYINDLVYMSLYRNERVFEEFSLLVTQQVISEDEFYFWDEMKVQSQRGGLFDAPPYNLKSNIHHTTDSTKHVSGHFGVIKETAVRWDFSIDDLSYKTDNYLRGDCLVIYGRGPDPAPECNSCLLYPNGVATISKPDWW